MLKFHWSMQMVGWSLVAVGALIMFVYGVLTRIVIPRIGETRAVYLRLDVRGERLCGLRLLHARLGNVRVDGSVAR